MKRFLPLALLGAVLVAAWLPLLPAEPIAGHSALSDRVRAEAIHAAVEGGDLWPIWLPDLYDRHGSPLLQFYAPLSYAVVELLRCATGSADLAIDLAFVAFWVVGAAGAWRAARELFGPEAGAPAAAAFALSPYLLADAYLRGGIAEFAGLALAPWAISGLVTRGRAAAAGGALAVAAVVLTHNLTALLVVPALVVLVLCGPRADLRRGLAIVAFGLALSAFFWWPALAGKDSVRADESLTEGFFDYQRHFVQPWNLLPFRTSLGFTAGPNERFPYRFGELLWFGVLAAPFACRGLDAATRRRAYALATGTVAALIMTTSLTAPLWGQLPLASYIQFPFRWFLLATVLAAPLVGLLVARLPERVRPWAAAVAVAMALVVGAPFLEVRYLFLDRATGVPLPVPGADLARAVADPRLVVPSDVITIARVRDSHWSGTAGHEYLPLTVSELPAGPDLEAAESRSGRIEIESAAWGYPEVRARVRVAAAGDIVLHQFDFPGWQVEVDGRRREHTVEPGRGRIVVPLLPGEREVVARFSVTPTRASAGIVSALAAIGGLFVLLRSRPKEPESE